MVHFSDDVDDFGVWDTFAGYECDTLEERERMCSFRNLGRVIQLGWGRDMKFTDAFRLEGLSAEWTRIRSEIPKASGRIEEKGEIFIERRRT